MTQLTLQVDGLTGGHAIVTLVEATCLVGSLYLLGGSNYHPRGEVGTDHNRNKRKLTHKDHGRSSATQRKWGSQSSHIFSNS